MNDIKRIVAIHDLSCFGKCSLTVALPIISASGLECSCIPTALLSTHTGEFTGFTIKDLSQEMLGIAKHWNKEGIEFDGIYTGYLASSKQVELIEQLIDTIASKNTKIIVDPVMADNGEYYKSHGEDICNEFKKLCSRADIITPNITEAAFLTSLPYEKGEHSEEYINSLLEGLKKVCPGIIAITGVKPQKGKVGVVAYDPETNKKYIVTRALEEGVFYGTGDIFASSFSALLIRGAGLENALNTALSLVDDSIKNTLESKAPRHYGVAFEKALPDYIGKITKLFIEK